MRNLARITLLLASVAAFGVEPSSAAEPSGFGEFNWGTPLAVIEKTMKAQCRFVLTYDTVDGAHGLRCAGYQMDDLGQVDLILRFTNDGLHEYIISVPRAHEAKLRAAAPKILQAAPATRPPAHPARKTSHWIDTCLPGFFCLTVRVH